jgi:integrase/recombinase XerD
MSGQATSELRQRMIEDMEGRRLSAATQRFHINSCKRFAAFLGRSPATATADDVRRFQHHLIEEGVSVISRNRTMTGVKFLVRVTLRRLDLANEIYHLREPQKIPQVLSRDEVERLLKMAGSLKSRCLLSLSYGCGLRAGEVVRLRAGDIDSGQGVIRIVQGKGRKDRNVMLPPDLLDLLRQWWKERPTRSDAGVPPAERWLFPGIKPGRPLTTRQFSRIFHQSAEAAGIRRPVTLHSLRHSFATHLLEGGTDIRRIQALLGHAKLDSTARYASVATGLIAGMESPLDGLTGKGRKARGKKSEPA